MSLTHVARIRFLSVCIIAIAALFAVRLFYIQVVQGEEYSDMADRQYLRPSGRMFDRGTIYLTERTGKLVSAATLKGGFLITINPAKVMDAEGTYAAINSILPLERDDFFAKVAKKDDPYEELATRVEQAQADQIQALDLPGVFIYKERWRFYPAGKLASHVIGFLGYKGDVYSGRYGLEKNYEGVLSRNDGMTFVNFFAEIFSGIGSSFLNTKADNQGDLVLSIEPIVQNHVEKELQNLVEKWQVVQAGGIVMDPHTGEIVAMAAWPNFDPGEKQQDLAPLNNPLVEQVYEMGSIVKPLTMAAALDTGAVTAKTTYNDAGYLVLNTKRISNFDGKGRGTVSMQEVLNQSLNTGVVFAMQKMGKDNFRNYMLGFGLGEKTGIDLPDENSGLVKNLDSNREIEHATAAFGQGIAITPIEMIRALAALANGGYLVEPHVVKRIQYDTLTAVDIKPKISRQVIKKETSEEISRMLSVVVDDALIGGKAKLPHHTIAAKTGTAQIAKPGGGGYYDDRYLHSFFGYFPAYNARFITFLYIVQPVGARYASETLTEPFMNITKFLLNYYEVPPDR
jgi:stage V sporulation protein D (sporulation-specific penicillin-binding protein)